MSELSEERCKPCEGGVAPLTIDAIREYLKALPHWQLNSSMGQAFIYRDFEFKNYYKTIAFVNAVAWLSHQENHHPDLNVSYNHCRIQYSTHAISGLSENNFICAAKVDDLGLL